MKTIHPEKFYLILGTGETYQARVVTGAQLLEGVIEMVFGEASNCKPAERDQWTKWLCDPDWWQTDPDGIEKTQFHIELGETDHLYIYLITEPLPEDAPRSKCRANTTIMFGGNISTIFAGTELTVIRVNDATVTVQWGDGEATVSKDEVDL